MRLECSEIYSTVCGHRARNFDSEPATCFRGRGLDRKVVTSLGRNFGLIALTSQIVSPYLQLGFLQILRTYGRGPSRGLGLRQILGCTTSLLKSRNSLNAGSASASRIHIRGAISRNVASPISFTQSPRSPTPPQNRCHRGTAPRPLIICCTVPANHSFCRCSAASRKLSKSAISASDQCISISWAYSVHLDMSSLDCFAAAIKTRHSSARCF